MEKQKRGTLLEILGVSTRLGFTSFGGPIAHLAIFMMNMSSEENGWTRKPTLT